jgi:hypothetical protein
MRNQIKIILSLVAMGTGAMLAYIVLLLAILGGLAAAPSELLWFPGMAMSLALVISGSVQCWLWNDRAAYLRQKGRNELERLYIAMEVPYTAAQIASVEENRPLEAKLGGSDP